MSNRHVVKIRIVTRVGFAVAVGAAAVLSPLTCCGREPAEAERSTAKSDEKLSPPAPTLKPKSDKESDDPFANTPPTKKAEVKPFLTDSLAEPKSTDSKTPSKTTKHSDNPFDGKEPTKGPAGANLSEDQIESAVAKDPRFQKAVLGLGALIKREGEAATQDTGKPVDQADAHIRANIPALIVERQLLDAQYRQITEQIGMQAKSVQDLEKFNGEEDLLRSEIDQLKAIVKDMGSTLTKWKIELDAAPRVSILERASVPEPVSPARQYVVAGFGGLLGFLFVLIAVVLFGLVFGKRKAPRDLGVESAIAPAVPMRSTRWIKWGLAICCGVLLGGALGSLGWFLFPAKYESAALIRVSIVDPAIWEPHSGVDFESYKRNAMAEIKAGPVLSRAVEDKAIQDFPIYKKNNADPVSWLYETLEAEYPGNGEFMRVSMRNEDPKGLKEIIDSVLAAFNTEVIEHDRTERLSRSDQLEKKLNSYKAQVLDKERSLYNLSQQIGTTGAGPAKVQYRMQTDALDTLLRQRTDIQAQLADVDFRLALAKALQELHKKTGAPAADEGKAAQTEKPKK